MRVWGYTIVKNAVKYDYPVIESIQSIMPLCDGIVVLHGDSEDDTSNLLKRLKNEKIAVHSSKWDPTIVEGGRVLAVESNKAKNLIPREADWCFYIQADEVLHDDSISHLRTLMQSHLTKQSIDGILLNYRHFYGSYDYLAKSSKWYKKEIRIVRNNENIISYKDAQGFRKKNGKKLQVIDSNAWIHHYGYVKDPNIMQIKVRDFHRLWHDEKKIQKMVGTKTSYDFQSIDRLERFKGTHPSVMEDRIAKKNWTFSHNEKSNRITIKDRVKRWLQRLSGTQIGDYQNYKIIKPK